MLLVKTFVAKSEIEGFGLFAAEDIKKGTEIWTFLPGFDLMLHKDFVNFHMSEETRRQVIHYGHREGDLYYLDSDDGRFFNSTPTPNTVAVADPMLADREYDGSKEMIPNHIVIMVAGRDIKAGEEITCNYGEFDDDYKQDPSFAHKESKDASNPSD